MRAAGILLVGSLLLLPAVSDAFSSVPNDRLPRQQPHPSWRRGSREIATRTSSSSPSPSSSSSSSGSGATTRLRERPESVTNLLGPISPATLENYNLPPDVIMGGCWSAEYVTRAAKSFDEAIDVRLVPRNPIDHYVDTVRVEIPIVVPGSSGSLGIELSEIEECRDDGDGVGIVIVSSLVPGGNAERAATIASGAGGGETVMFGDSIVTAEAIVTRRRGGTTDVASVRTECLGYDSTARALSGMMSSLLLAGDGEDDDDRDQARSATTVVLTLKRLRRHPDIRVLVRYPPSSGLPPETMRLLPGDNLRMAMLRRGVELNDPLAARYDGKAPGSGNCGGSALCRTCAVSVVRGGDLLSRPKTNESKMIEAGTGGIGGGRMRLSCKSWVGYGMKEGEIVIQVNPRQWGN